MIKFYWKENKMHIQKTLTLAFGVTLIVGAILTFSSMVKKNLSYSQSITCENIHMDNVTVDISDVHTVYTRDGKTVTVTGNCVVTSK